MKKHKTAAGVLIIFLIAFTFAPREAAGSAADEGDFCSTLWAGCVANAAVISITDGPAYLLSFSDFLPSCAAAYIWCKIFY